MLEVGLVVFNYESVGLWAAFAMWVWLAFMMPKRAFLGLLLSIAIVSYYVMYGELTTCMCEKIYVGWVLVIGILFTSMMSPLMIATFFLGYKTTR